MPAYLELPRVRKILFARSVRVRQSEVGRRAELTIIKVALAARLTITIRRLARNAGEAAFYKGATRMAALKGSKTEENLKAAFSGESQANRRYLYFAAKADVEGHNDVSAVFRSTAEGETGHAHGHLEYLEEVGDPATGEPIVDTVLNLKASIAGETHEYTDMYPGMARTARQEGFDEIADWFRSEEHTSELQSQSNL